MIEFKGPSGTEIKTLIKEKHLVEFHLIGDKTLVGKLKWCDEQAIQIHTEDGRIITILKTAILYYLRVG